MDFSGRYPHTLDAKGRLTIPVQFRDGLADGLYITIGFKDCLLVYPRAEFNALSLKLKSLPSMNTAISAFRHLVIENAFPLDLDSMGRILVPSVLRAQINLEQEAMVAGNVSFIEIWRPDVWQAITDKIRASGDNANVLSDFGI